MDRNIITEADAKRAASKAHRPGDLTSAVPKTASGVQEFDTYLDQLLKYVPMEVIGGYLFIEGLLKELLDTDSLSIGLLILFVLGLIAAWFFAKRVLNVIRTSQLVITACAFFVWVLATGGWFATLGFWAPGWGTVAIAAFAIMVRILKIDPLPEEQGA